nr:uncharacterized protein LOC101032257 [Saimiri boliviensis boliviensis]
MESDFLPSAGAKLGPSHTPKHMPKTKSLPPVLPGQRDPVPVEVEKRTPVQKAEAVAQREGAAFPGPALGLETQGAEMLAAGATHPSQAIGASRRAPRGRGAGRSGPGCPRAARPGQAAKPSPWVEVLKLLIPRMGRERASGRRGRSFEPVYLKTLQEESARNSRISSEAANICRRGERSGASRAAESLPPEPRRRPGRTRPRS